MPVTQRDIAKASGLTQSGVSRALRGDPSIPEATRVLVFETAQRLGYHADLALAEAMQRIRDRKGTPDRGGFAFFIHSTVQPEAGSKLAAILDAFRERAAHFSYHVEVIRPQLEFPERPERSLEVAYARGVQGFAFYAPGPVWPSRFFHGLRDLRERDPRIGTIMLGGGGGSASQESLQIATPNLDAAGRLAARQMVAHGYRRPAFFSLADWSPEYRNFADAVRGEMARLIKDRMVENYRSFAELQRIGKGKQPDCFVIRQNDRGPLSAASAARMPHLEYDLWPNDDRSMAGINLHYPVLAKALADLLVAQAHRGFLMLPEVAVQVNVLPSWQNGGSLPDQSESLRLELAYPAARHQPQAAWRLLDLQPVANRSLTASVAQRWPCDDQLARLPQELMAVHGVPFQLSRDSHGPRFLSLGDPATAQRTASLVMPRWRKSIGAIYFLHLAGFITGSDSPLARYRFRYADGTTTDQAIIAGGMNPRGGKKRKANIQDWWRTYPPIDGPNFKYWTLNYPLSEPWSHRNLYTLEWKNPWPEKRIQSVEVELTSKGEEQLALMAMTALCVGSD